MERSGCEEVNLEDLSDARAMRVTQVWRGILQGNTDEGPFSDASNNVPSIEISVKIAGMWRRKGAKKRRTWQCRPLEAYCALRSESPPGRCAGVAVITDRRASVFKPSCARPSICAGHSYD